ncbi:MULTISPECIES: hypothetical protein [Pseudoalteromonas]|uniref:hypothetical protein n=1 Tax=Pseudoalteromonas TaxID=53246 RepID=UPI0002D4FEE6|nr:MULTISPECIES: hypothetical protein [Pseudoalteromonas]MCF6144422.1 hypothetical protein [Pseudoalteromonas mariniglutinosa NCIMB 1770]TMN70924.1 hypothetical protein CWB85_13635 [Pseudoalteromonas sp. S1727]
MNIQAANQVNQYQLNTRLSDANKQVATAQTTPVEKTAKTDVIQISAQARALNAQPITPEVPAIGQIEQPINNKVQQYLDIQKSLAKADAVDNFTDDNFSIGEAYLAKNNDTVRNAYLAKDNIEQTNEIADIMIDSIDQDDEQDENNLLQY